MSKFDPKREKGTQKEQKGPKKSKRDLKRAKGTQKGKKEPKKGKRDPKQTVFEQTLF